MTADLGTCFISIIIIASYRETALGEPFGMFDFTPVGLAVTVVGVLFITLVGWRLIPAERSQHNSSTELFDVANYIAEVRVPETSWVIDKKVSELDDAADEADVVILGLIRRGAKLPGRARRVWPSWLPPRPPRLLRKRRRPPSP